MQDEAGAPLTAADESTSPPTASAAAAKSPDDTSRDVRGPRHHRSSLLRLMAVMAALTLAADQATKAWALAALTPGEPVNLIGDLIRLNLIRNAGAAFSIGDGATWVLTLIACGVLVFILRTARRIGSLGWAWGLGLLLGGSVGNLTDRMTREPGPGRGHVVDFIDYFGLFIGNVADIAIVGAAFLIGILALRGIGVDGQHPHHGRHEAAHG